jgi:DsbC/DsbD-like thiol-disulfide interchange protein
MPRVFVIAFGLSVAALLAGTPGSARGQKWYEKAVKKVEGRFAPTEAKPGQTVTFSLTIELNEGYHTYPTKQPDKMAAGMANLIKFPEPGSVIFVGTFEDPKGYLTKEEPVLGIKEIRYYPGSVTFTRKAVVSPKATAGATTVKLATFSLSVCDKNTCFPPKTLPIEAALKILDGPPVPIEKEFAEEVTKVLGEK